MSVSVLVSTTAHHEGTKTRRSTRTLLYKKEFVIFVLVESS